MTTIVSSSFTFIKTLFKHLWLSISSVKFYKNVYSNYSGYGIKHILNLAMISSFLCTAILLNFVNNITKYLEHDQQNTDTMIIDHVLNQLPTFYYNGKIISTEQNTPIFINSPNNAKIMLIDLENKTNRNESTQVPFVLSSKTMTINPQNHSGIGQKRFQLNYEDIFGSEEKILTHEVIKDNLAKIFQKMPNFLIYIAFPIISFMIVILTIIEKTIAVILLYFLTNAFGMKSSIQTIIRMTLFASSFGVLFEFIFLTLALHLEPLFWVIQAWANLLMILGILTANNRLKFIRL